MSTSSKSQQLQMLRMMLYRRPLHPELFTLDSRRSIQHGGYEVEQWIVPGGHIVRFQIPGQSLTEVIIEAGDHLPETGLVHALPAFGEKEYEMPAEGKLGFCTTIQTETLTDNLYQSTYREMVDFARETGSHTLSYNDPDAGPCLSLIDSQKYRREYHIQAYHLHAGTGLVLRTQSIFEITD
ncbi:MAG: hypothetical protein AAF328_02560 [Planctomycetota bacterium]